MATNLRRLACTPGGRLLDEGQLMLDSAGDLGGLGEVVLRAIPAGRTRHSEIEQGVRTEPGRVLDRLVESRLLERVVPVTERRVARELGRKAEALPGLDPAAPLRFAVAARERVANAEGVVAVTAGEVFGE